MKIGDLPDPLFQKAAAADIVLCRCKTEQPELDIWLTAKHRWNRIGEAIPAPKLKKFLDQWGDANIVLVEPDGPSSWKEVERPA